MLRALITSFGFLLAPIAALSAGSNDNYVAKVIACSEPDEPYVAQAYGCYLYAQTRLLDPVRIATDSGLHFVRETARVNSQWPQDIPAARGRVLSRRT
jgi:hypothetical protein